MTSIGDFAYGLEIGIDVERPHLDLLSSWESTAYEQALDLLTPTPFELLGLVVDTTTGNRSTINVLLGVEAETATPIAADHAGQLSRLFWPEADQTVIDTTRLPIGEGWLRERMASPGRKVFCFEHRRFENPPGCS